jgi:hypothetical protein
LAGPCRGVLLYAVIRDSRATRSGMTRVQPFCWMRCCFLKPAKSRLTVSREVPIICPISLRESGPISLGSGLWLRSGRGIPSIVSAVASYWRPETTVATPSGQTRSTIRRSLLLSIPTPGDQGRALPTDGTTTDFSCVHNFVISSNDRPLVSGISQATSTTVKSAPPLKSQKVPSDPRRRCIIGKSWLPR